MKSVGIYTSGGDSPGMNAAIRAATRTALKKGLRVFGIQRGYSGMIEGEIDEMSSESVANILQHGGTILKSSRSKEFLTEEGRNKAYANLKKLGIEYLLCIGGNGSYAGADKIHKEINIPIIGIPGTIDNDLYGTDYTIGFHTAVHNAVEAIDKIRDTAHAHDRTFFVEVMGRDSGNLAMQVGLCVGAEAVLIPEKINDLDYLLSKFEKRRERKGFSLVVVAEGDNSGGAMSLAIEFKKHFPNTEEKVTILGHIQRGGSPVANDRILASKLGYKAVLNLIEGKTGALGIVDNEYNLIPFEKAIANHKVPDTSLWDINSYIS